ncbi:MAG: TonB-dependent receptor plug domain-containing protein [Flavisolibacter sp.]|nr:TonB-dependent receptor plug domain-containing protein [Flavisolibacter sp.]
MKVRFILRNLFATFFFSILSLYSWAQAGFPVSGRVTDADGKPLAGVTIQVRGTSTTTTSKADGAFQITAPSANAVLVFSYVGFTAQTVPVNNRSQITLSLSSQSQAMENIVVVGYGTQRKSDVTGSLASISAKTIQERPAQNVLQAMQGKAAGVHVSSNLRPGELPVIRVRGNRSLTASNDPLYVVDGIPLVNALGVNSFTMADLNPNDIASIEILKDASATAIYGSRA